MNDPLLHNCGIVNKELFNLRIISWRVLNLTPGLTLKTIISVIFTPYCAVHAQIVQLAVNSISIN